ncbi:aliphatic sulfonate ABC transporter substrate-binding protein [Shinella sp. HZN7]|jgi:sulfonate transport system substrate-binding protein|uniref:aliphatic sulfonate ABC transporter substrate-binding protein n=1 Tax=Shinella sp. (strain HZN7) TaxID=879274 RepID=UPI0007DA746D|nr:sulfonate ABC transporter substrate-binding protein [Shinella sp. HZN7]
MSRFSLSRMLLALAAIASFGLAAPAQAEVKEITIDFATYNPVGLLLKEKGWLEESLKEDGVSVRWIQSQGSNKALEFLNAGSIDFGSTAGAAALVGKINGNPIKSVYVYSRPEWTALVKPKGSPITKVEDLKGKRVAVTRGTDPHIFLIRALADHGLTDKDVEFVLLQHADGKAALVRGDVDAWAGLDPLTAAAEVEDGAELFYRKPELNTWGVLNVREAFASENPQLVERVLAAYERARKHALENPAELTAALVKVAKLPENVIARQIERTDITHSAIGDEQKATILEAGLALQRAGVVDAGVDVKAVVDALIDPSFKLATN